MGRWMGDPDADADLLRERSPIRYVDSIRAPLLVVHGANDPRVGIGESDRIVRRLRELGRTVEYLAFADEGHRFHRVDRWVAVLGAVAQWFERSLLSEPRSSVENRQTGSRSREVER